MKHFLPKLCVGMVLTCAVSFMGQDIAHASEARVKAQLDAVATQLVNHAAQNVLPKPSQKAVSQEGGAYVARYIAIDTTNVSTQLHKGQGQDYVGMVKYNELHFICKGASKAEALQAPCSRERTRKMTEILAYTKGKWLYHQK